MKKKDAPNFPKKNYWCFNTKNYNLDDDWKLFYSQKSHDFIEGKTPMMYLSFPSSKDPTFSERHPGKSKTVTIIAPVNWDWFTDLLPDYEMRWEKQRALNTQEYIGKPK